MMRIWALVATALFGFTGAAIGDMVSEEFRTRLDRLPRIIIRLAIWRLPRGHQKDRGLEYKAELERILEERKGLPLTRIAQGLRYALGLLRVAGQVAGQLDGQDRPQLSSRVFGSARSPVTVARFVKAAIFFGPSLAANVWATLAQVERFVSVQDLAQGAVAGFVMAGWTVGLLAPLVYEAGLKPRDPYFFGPLMGAGAGLFFGLLTASPAVGCIAFLAFSTWETVWLGYLVRHDFNTCSGALFAVRCASTASRLRQRPVTYVYRCEEPSGRYKIRDAHHIHVATADETTEPATRLFISYNFDAEFEIGSTATSNGRGVGIPANSEPG